MVATRRTDAGSLRKGSPNMSLEEALLEHTAALKENTEILKRVVAGQQAALDKLDGAKASGSTGRGRGKKEEPAAQEPEKAPEPTPTPEPETTSFLPAIKVGDDEALKAHVQPWLGAAEKGTPEATARVDFLKDAAKELGVNPKFTELAADADRLKQFLFFFERKKAGLEVNFSADYDFDGDPTQGGSAPADDSDFG